MTKVHEDPERAEAEQRVWEDLRFKLAALQTYMEALQLVVEGAPPPDAPGRRHYANLAIFLQRFQVPVHSSQAEKEAYLQLVRRLEAAGQLKPGVGKQLEDALLRAMEARGR